MSLCPYCNSINADNAAKCLKCYFPFVGTSEDVETFVASKRKIAAAEVEGAKKYLVRCRIIFLFLSAVFFTLAAACWFYYDRLYLNGFSVREQFAAIYAVQGCLYVVCAIFMNKNPLLFSILGFLIFLLTAGMNLLGVIILIILGAGIYQAVEYYKAGRKYKKLTMLSNRFGRAARPKA